MKFGILEGLFNRNNQVKETNRKGFFPFFGIKKGELIAPLKNDVINFSTKDRTSEENFTSLLNSIAEKSFGNKEMFSKYLRAIIETGTEKNPELKEQRIMLLRTNSEEKIDFYNKLVILELNKNENTSFLFDNQNTISKIFKEKHIPDGVQMQILQALTSENFTDFVNLSKNKNLTPKDFAIQVREHIFKDENSYFETSA